MVSGTHGEARMMLTREDEVSVYDVLEKGLSDLMDVCDVVLEKFEEAVEANPKTEEV